MTTRAISSSQVSLWNANDICVHNELALYNTHYSAFPRFLILSTLFFIIITLDLTRWVQSKPRCWPVTIKTKKRVVGLAGLSAGGPSLAISNSKSNKQTKYNNLIITRAKTTSFNLICHQSIWGTVILEVLRQQAWFFCQGQTNFCFKTLIDGYFSISHWKKENKFKKYSLYYISLTSFSPSFEMEATTKSCIFLNTY